MKISHKLVDTIAIVVLFLLLVWGWSDVFARDVLVTECGTVFPEPKPVPDIRIVKFAQSCRG